MIEKSVEGFLEELSSSSATPGGGSAAALMGSMGAALVSMVANLTTGKKKYEAVEKEVLDILEQSEKLRKQLQEAVKKVLRPSILLWRHMVCRKTRMNRNSNEAQRYKML